MKSATVVATIDRPISATALAGLPPGVAWLEVRADLVGEIDPLWLRKHFAGRLLYALRSRSEGGTGDSSPSARERQILRAARDYDFIELETGDLTPSVLAAIPPPRRVIAWHGPAGANGDLASRLAYLSSWEARLYRVVPRAQRSGDELAPLALLHSVERRDVAAYAEGPAALWTRVAALQLGAPAVFGSVADDVEADGVPSAAQLVADYGLPSVPEAAELFAIAGSPVYRSLSPRLHNSAFRILHRPSLYVPFHVDDFDDFWQSTVAGGALDALGLPLRGICVVSPHKEIALAAARSKTYFVQQAGSTNFMSRDDDGVWTADTTDPEGVLLTLRERHVEPAKRRVAVVGCGGSGRAIAAALSKAGADVTLVNRGRARAALAVRLLKLPFVPLADFSAHDFSIVVNATPLGRDGESLPFVVDPSRNDTVVVDLVYGSKPTPLVAAARMAGQITIDGVDVLLAQVRSQFRLMTREEMPRGVADRVAHAQPRREIAAGTR
jgi:3-dehydroquinate dehydratase / shikimate dehydrogenase